MFKVYANVTWSDIVTFMSQLLQNCKQDVHSDMKPTCSDAVRLPESSAGLKGALTSVISYFAGCMY